MPVAMVCPRHFTLRSKTGHVVKFEPGKPSNVPDDVVQEALALNILPVDADNFADPTLLEGLRAKGPVNINLTGAIRDAVVYHVLHEIARENDVNNFDGGGRPKTFVIIDRTGVQITSAERNTYWDKYRELKGAGEELPTHKAVDAVLEVQYLSTPKQLIEYASLYDVPFTHIEGRTLKEQKAVIVGAILAESHAHTAQKGAPAPETTHVPAKAAGSKG